ncbi:MAG TPA: MBOAT family protein [Burkholderiales bacterium]
MLFNSYVFLLAFLPLAVVAFYTLNRLSRAAAIFSLVVFSLVYYAWWDVAYVPLLVGSILANYALGRRIQTLAPAHRRAAYALSVVGIAANLALLAYFKYAHFLADIVGLGGTFGSIVLPLAISFYTFQQIMYLVDSLRGDVAKEGLLQYTLYVMFFPHLIAGPLVHHREMMPQFSTSTAKGFRAEDLSVGLSLFVVGLAKKVLIADELSRYAAPVFAAAAADGPAPDFYAAWCGVLCYTFQIYFDFSGYSDMAIGAARLFGIRLPLNFFSPYRATSIIDFWRCWHMTLSRLLRNYLYIPLGGNRKGRVRRYVNLMITMLLGGLWHGAGWTFVIWGALHGAYLGVNHAWRALKARLGWRERDAWWTRFGARLLTFLAVMLAWVFFRAEDLPSALRLLDAMSGAQGLSMPARVVSPATAAHWGVVVSSLPAGPFFAGLLLLALVWLAPNSWEIFRAREPALLPKSFELASEPVRAPWLAWRPSPAWALAVAALACGALLGMLSGRSEFLYYQF